MNRQEQKKSEPKAQDETKRSLRVQLSEFRFCSKLFQQLLIVTTLQEKLKMGDKTRKMPRLWHLCVDGKLDEVRSALARGEDVNDKDSIGWTALMRAVWNKHNPIVKLLLDQPAVDVNVKNIRGWTALHRAASANNAEGARMLLLHKNFKSANVTDNGGLTALMVAVICGKEEVLRELVKHQSVSLDVGMLAGYQR